MKFGLVIFALLPLIHQGVAAPIRKTHIVAGAIGGTVGFAAGSVKGTKNFILNAFDRNGVSHGTALKSAVTDASIGAIAGGWGGPQLADRARDKMSEWWRRKKSAK
jgi:Na+/glutamate symporter